MPTSITNHLRDALLTVALFGGIGVAMAQSPAPSSGNIESAQHPQVPGRAGVEEPSAQQAPKPGAESGVFVDGRLNVPDAPAETSTTPSKVSRHNAQLDEIPIMARGPQLTDAQRKLIVERVMAAGGAPAHVDAFPTVELPAGVEMHSWPSDIAGEVPGIRGTKYVNLSDKILVVRPENRIVVEEIPR
jgi:type IV secretory pathway VirJ component